MLIKRKHIVPVLIALLIFPAAALASDQSGGAQARVGLTDARAIEIAPLRRPVERFQRLVRAAVRRIEAKRRAALRKQRRERLAAFATLPGGVSQATLDSIAACESGGDPTALSADGSYRGKYQFDYGTWASMGGSGDPAAAPEQEQDYRAALLYSQAGSSPWPVCG